MLLANFFARLIADLLVVRLVFAERQVSDLEMWGELAVHKQRRAESGPKRDDHLEALAFNRAEALHISVVDNTDWLAETLPAVMGNGVEVAPLSPVAPAVRVYPVPARSMLRPGKVATPATAATVVVPESTPPVGLVPIASVMLPVKLVTVFPNASRALTWMAGVIAAPAAALEGCTVNARSTATPAVTVNAALVAGVNAPDVARRV